MTNREIQKWLSYWQDAKMVDVTCINSLADMATARRFCPCMSVGAFGGVSDQALWDALDNKRVPRYAPLATAT